MSVSLTFGESTLRIGPYSESTYKLPNRVVYNETMKKSFLSDLADERIPLNSPKFAKSVPHGMKGQDLLEMLWTKRIKVDRAVWLVQTLGAHDVVSGEQR